MLWMIAAGWAWTTDVDVFTSVPTDIGFRIVEEGPGRLRLMGSAGLMPRAYLDMTNDLAVSSGWYNEDTAELIDVALQDALCLRLHLGWRPFPKAGFQFAAGYGMLGLGGGIAGSDLLSIVTGYEIPDFIDGYFDYKAQAVLHRAEVTIGWEWVIREHVRVRLDLGGSYTLDARAKLEPDFEVPGLVEPFLDELEEKTEADLEEVLERYVHTPILSVGVGWRF